MMVKVSLKYSIICGLFLILLFWLSLRLGSNPLLELRHFFFDVVIFFLFVFFAAKEYKQYHKGGYLHFWEGMSIAFIVYIPASVIFALGLLLLFWQEPLLMQSYKEGAMAFLESKKEFLLENIRSEEYSQKVQDIEQMTIRGLVLSSGIKKIIAGFFVAPVISVILRKKYK